MPPKSEKERREARRKLDKVNKQRAEGKTPIGKRNEAKERKEALDSIGRKIRTGPEIVEKRKRTDKEGKGESAKKEESQTFRVVFRLRRKKIKPLYL